MQLRRVDIGKPLSPCAPQCELGKGFSFSEILLVLELECGTTPPCGKPQMVGSLARYIVRGDANAFRGGRTNTFRLSERV